MGDRGGRRREELGSGARPRANSAPTVRVATQNDSRCPRPHPPSQHLFLASVSPGVRVKRMAEGGGLHSHHSAAEPTLSSRLPGASVQQADIDPVQPSSIPAPCSPLCSGPTKRRGLTPRAAPAEILCRNKPPRAPPEQRTRLLLALSGPTWRAGLPAAGGWPG